MNSVWIFVMNLTGLGHGTATWKAFKWAGNRGESTQAAWERLSVCLSLLAFTPAYLLPSQWLPVLASIYSLPLLQWYGHPRVLGISIPKTLVIWVSPSHITLAIWVRVSVSVRVTGDAHITRVLGMRNDNITVTPLRLEYGTEPILFMTLHFRDRRGAALPDYRNRAGVSVRMKL